MNSILTRSQPDVSSLTYLTADVRPDQVSSGGDSVYSFHSDGPDNAEPLEDIESLQAAREISHSSQPGAGGPRNSQGYGYRSYQRTNTGTMYMYIDSMTSLMASWGWGWGWGRVTRSFILPYTSISFYFFLW